MEQSDARNRNRLFSEQCIRLLDPDFRHRWEEYSALVSNYLSNDKIWIDVGCGKAESLNELGTKAKFAAGVDLRPLISTNFPCLIQADLRAIPIRTDSVDVVTLRFVVEHLQHIPDDFFDITRILKPGGVLILITTNTSSPFIAVPRLFPYRFKNFLLRNIYKVNSQDVFPTFHRFNCGRRLKQGTKGLELVELHYLQDANYVRKWVFVTFFAWHLLTKVIKQEWLRTNILTVFQKRQIRLK